MTRKFFEVAFTPEVLAAQAENYGRDQGRPDQSPADALGGAEQGFIASRDSFYLASVSSTGWPYIQHRGGARGFLQVLDSRRLAFLDLVGNRQLVSVGNLTAEDRVALFLMDYPRKRRLKIMGRAEVRPLDDAEFAEVFSAEARVGAERIVLIEIVAYDWNCPKYIKPRFSEEEVSAHVAGFVARIAELEAELLALRAAKDGAR
jgi:predicted pyridoxine 5'-phosphate oxidase superfamily flavin-nucleotide-binding protein